MRNSQPNIPPAIKKLISELGLRYRPSAQADLQEHAATLALLARDLADVPPRFLERAINQWVVKSPYLPKASDLVSIAKSFVDRRVVASSDMTLAERYNVRLNTSSDARRDVRWVGEDNDLHLETTA